MRKHYRLESELEHDCTEAAKKLGAEHRKLDTGINSKGQLDHAYWLPGGFHFIVEFKMPGLKPSPLQQRRIDRLLKLGHTVYVIDNYADFLRILGVTP